MEEIPIIIFYLMQTNKPILITGSHRSGSSWVGRVIASGGNVSYFTEPLNPRIEINRFLFNHNTPKIWFPAIQYLNTKDYYNGYKKILEPDFCCLKLIPKKFTELKYFFKLNFKLLFKRRPLLKDPIALFSSEWLSDNFNTANIVLIRRPEAFISSLKKNNWSFDFDNLLRQDKLINDFFPEYKDEIESFAKSNARDIIEQGILLWNIFHSYILKMKALHPDWYFVTHESLSLTPQKEFKKLFNYLNLDFNHKVKKYIKQTTNSENNTERSSSEVHVLYRNSKKNIFTWKKRLLQEEIIQIKNCTNEIANKLYL